MRFFIPLFFIAVLTHCSSNDFVYMCGDHVCLNDKERLAYFKKTMIVEIRDANKNSIKKSPEEKNRIKAAKLEQKKRIKEEKRIKKQAKIAEKIRNKKIRDLEKISKKEKKIKIKKVDENAATGDQQVAEKDVAVLSELNLANGLNNFEEILQSISSRSINKPFPDINDFPK